MSETRATAWLIADGADFIDYFKSNGKRFSHKGTKTLRKY
jgi:hypothetical protein